MWDEQYINWAWRSDSLTIILITIDAMETSKGWAITRCGSLDAMEIFQHSSLVINGKLYNWGGGRPNMPSIFVIGNLTSFVDVCDIPSLSWSRVPTVGIPPTAVMGYSCVSINDVIYFFGGYCQPDDSYHNSLFTLSISSNTWNQIFFHGGEVCPMKKYGHGMVSFSNDKGDYLLTIGGFGPTSTSKSSSAALYTPSPSLLNKCFTNETHILHISSLQGRLKTIEDNRVYFRSIVESILFCCQQGISLRGHRETINTEDTSVNIGNFRALMVLQSRCNEIIKQKLTSGPKNATWLGHDIQNSI